jgi:hypothetical protein
MVSFSGTSLLLPFSVASAKPDSYAETSIKLKSPDGFSGFRLQAFIQIQRLAQYVLVENKFSGLTKIFFPLSASAIVFEHEDSSLNCTEAILEDSVLSDGAAFSNCVRFVLENDIEIDETWLIDKQW